jgi:hypothetical protein
MEFKEIAEILGIDSEKVKTIDEFKQNFESEFVRISQIPERKDVVEKVVNPIVGRRLGTLETEFKKTAKEYGIDLTADEYKGKPVEEIGRILLNKSAEKFGETVKELEDKLKAGGDEKVQKYQKELEDWKKKYSETQSLLDNTSSRYKELEQSKNTEIKQFKLNQLKSDVYKSVDFKDGMTELEKAGFEAILNSKYALDYDEAEGLIVKDKNGNRITSEKVVGKFKSYQDVLKDEAIAQNLFKLNTSGGKPVVKTIFNQQPQTQDYFTKKVHPRALG